jgi:hypothetical protein
MYCPMLKSQCHMHDCAWYTTQFKQCAVPIIAYALDNASDHLHNISHVADLMEGKITLLGVNND